VYDINNPRCKVIANQFSLPDHSIVSMKVCIIEKIYCHTTDPRLSEQITAMPYSCNEKKDRLALELG
jgi:hypothetical protein